jgi:hypothetical protein
MVGMLSRAGPLLPLLLFAGACASEPRQYDCSAGFQTDEGMFTASSPFDGSWYGPNLIIFFAPPIVNGKPAGQDAPSYIRFQFGFGFAADIYKRGQPLTVRVNAGDRVRPAVLDKYQANATIGGADLAYLLEGEADFVATLHTSDGDVLQQVVLARPMLKRIIERMDSLQAKIGEKERNPKALCEDVTGVRVVL